MTKQGLKKGVQKTKWGQAKLVLIYILLQVLVEHWHYLKVKPKPNTYLKPKPLNPKCLNLKPNWKLALFSYTFSSFHAFPSHILSGSHLFINLLTYLLFTKVTYLFTYYLPKLHIYLLAHLPIVRDANAMEFIHLNVHPCS